MKQSQCTGIAIAVIFTLLVGALAASGFAVRAEGVAPGDPIRVEGVIPVVIHLAPGVSEFRVPPPPALAQNRIQATTIVVNFLPQGSRDALGSDCYTWPTEARAAFDYAASIWEALIVSPVPITVNACYTEMAGTALGYGGPSTFYLVDDSFYPVALANALSGSDRNGPEPEVHVAYNRLYDWYWGTDGTTPPDQTDFASVALHEIGHGLGFIGSMMVDGVSGLGYWGFGYNLPAVFDRFVQNGYSEPLLTFPNYSAALAAQLTGGNLYLSSAAANAANGGTPVKLFAPSTWMPGSSYCHLDEIYNDTQNALMTYSIRRGESIHDPGPIVMAILQDQGWQITQSHPDLALSMALLNNTNPAPGDQLVFALMVSNGGTGTATGVTLTAPLPPSILASTWQVSPVLEGTTAQAGSRYVWHLPDLSPGETGVLSVYGTLDPDLLSGTAVVVSAVIDAAEDDTREADNVAALVIGGCRVYLPLASRER